MPNEYPEYRICRHCVMDISDPKITFDESGLCTHCRRFAIHSKQRRASGQFGEEALGKLFEHIKTVQKNKQYDCIIGVSGGLDSSYIGHLARKHNLRALCVHLDNGWNSELAVKNIERMIRKLNFDLHTHVLDWEEFKDLQLAVFKASVVDIEMVTDHAISATLYKIAAENDIRFLISGNNYETEFVMPFSWNYYKMDVLNMLHIHSLFGSRKIKTFPFMDQYRLWEYSEKTGIQNISPLHYLPFNKNEAMTTLERELGWKYYGQKHFESVFTRFYQGYILPVKFQIDKRRAHFSSMILSEQMTREAALAELEKPVYTPGQLEEDKGYVIKKWGLTAEEFEAVMKSPVKKHTDYYCSFPPRL